MFRECLMMKLNRIEQSGRSMVEMLGVLAIIGVLSVGGIAGYSKAMTKFKINKSMDQISMLVANIRTLFSGQRNYSGLSNTNAISFGIIPGEMDGGGAVITNAFAGDDLGHGQIVKQGQQWLFIEERQPVFHTHIFLPVADGFVEFIFLTVSAKSLAVFGAEVFDGIVINHDLVHDLKAIAFQLAGGALTHDIKSTNLFNFIVKQINTQRLFGSNRKDI